MQNQAEKSAQNTEEETPQLISLRGSVIEALTNKLCEIAGIEPL